MAGSNTNDNENGDTASIHSYGNASVNSYSNNAVGPETIGATVGNSYGNGNGNSYGNGNGHTPPHAEVEERSRRMILESYEKAGVDLPLVTLETVLDREISEDDARKTGTPRFKRFLHRALSPVAGGSGNGNHNRNSGMVENALADASFSPPPSEPFASGSGGPTADSYGLAPPSHTHPDGPNEGEGFATAEATTTATATAFPRDEPKQTESPSKDTACHPTFDFCCPKPFAEGADPNDSVASSNKYIMSNLQIPEGFEDEYQPNQQQNHQQNYQQNLEKARASPALADDAEDSMLHSSFGADRGAVLASYSDSYGRTKSRKPGASSGNSLVGYLRSSRRFRWAMAVCCLLHVVLIGLVIAFVRSMDHEAALASASASAGASASETASSGAASASEPPQAAPPATESIAGTFAGSASTAQNAPANATEEPPVATTDDDDAEGGSPSASAVAVELPGNANATQAPAIAPPCVDTLELSAACVGAGDDLVVFFEACSPLPGDWVAIYASADDSQNLLDGDALGWTYTCGDRFCGTAVERENLSFARAVERAGPGVYRAHLIRGSEGPLYQAFASSGEFTVVGPAGGCPGR